MGWGGWGLRRVARGGEILSYLNLVGVLIFVEWGKVVGRFGIKKCLLIKSKKNLTTCRTHFPSTFIRTVSCRQKHLYFWLPRTGTNTVQKSVVHGTRENLNQNWRLKSSEKYGFFFLVGPVNDFKCYMTQKNIMVPKRSNELLQFLQNLIVYVQHY